MSNLTKEIVALVKKDFVLEWKDRTALNSIILYVFSTVFVCYLSFSQKRVELNPITWNTLFWIIMLFAAINTIGKSFDKEQSERFHFYFTLVSPQAIILSKILYNTFLMLLTGGVGLFVYALVMGNPVDDMPLFLANVGLGSLGFAATLTTIAGIAAKSDNNSTLMAILGFPVMLPMILMLIKVSKNAMDGLDRSVSFDELLVIVAVDVIVVTVSYMLYPYLWRS